MIGMNADPKVAAAVRLLTTVYRVRLGMLVFTSAICMTRGIAYVQFQDLPHGLEIVGRLIPLWVFALVWLASAVYGLYVAARRRKGIGLLAVQVALFALWGWGYALAWILSNFSSADWIASSFYLCMAGVVSLLGFLPARLWAE